MSKKKALSKQNDWELITAALEGDDIAYASLFTKFKDNIYRTIYEMVRNVEVAEDLTMEVFAKAFRNLHQYQPSHTFLTWLNTVAKNHTLDFLRKKKPDNISLDATLDTGSGKVLLQVEDQEPTPDEELEQEEMMKRVHNLVEMLKPRYKTLIQARYFDELSYEEIAEKMSIPLGTVKAQLFRARDLLFQIVKNKRESL